MVKYDSKTRRVDADFVLNTEEKISDRATCGWSNTIQKRDMWTQIFFLNTEENISVLENIRLRVDGQIRVKNATCGRRFCFKYGGKNLCFRKYPATCGRGLITTLLTCHFKTDLAFLPDWDTMKFTYVTTYICQLSTNKTYW